jgi:APA family basic amino acid/polyamine antiporter
LSSSELKKVLGRGFSVAACIGLIIGLGILRTPGEIATMVNDPWIYMSLWIGGGIFVILSTVVVAELISLTPRSGGVYSLVSRAFGQFPAFVIGWIDWLASCAALALKSVVVVEYISMLVPTLVVNKTLITVVITSVFALLQFFGTRTGGQIQQIASTGIGLIVIGLTCMLSYAAIVNGGPGVETMVASLSGPSGFAAYGLIASAIIFTYDGWLAASYFSGEVESGGRGVAIGSLQGILIVVILYITLNFTLVSSVPLSSLQGEDLALAAALSQLFGENASMVVIASAVFILLAHHNLQYMICARVLYSLSVDGFGSKSATQVSDNGVPAVAVALTWLLSVALILIGDFEILLTMSATLFVVMYVSLVLGVFKLRKTEPETARPFSAWGFPYSGIFCAVGWVLIATYVAVTSLESTLYGVLLILLALPVFLVLRRVRHLEVVAS